MYSLFEIRKVLTVSKPGGSEGVKIVLAAYTENKDNSVLALVCSNGYLLFRLVSAKLEVPVIRQLCWFNNPEKEIRALSFDSSGMWLLTVTRDATLYILPISSIGEFAVKTPASWKIDNLTEIKLTGQRALTTSVQWWLTHESEHIAIIGSELGEISFINLVNKKEVGGTYITSGISALDILYDESHDTTYLLITGSNQQQWRLLLEEKKSNFYWPFNSDTEITSYNSGKGLPVAEKVPLTDDKNSDQRPHRLSKFESGTFLTPQCGDGRNLVSAYNSSSCLLQVLEGDLDRMHLFSYKVPPDCENIILSDKLIFATSKNHSTNQHILKVISRKFAEISSENSKKREAQTAEIQKFVFNDEILAIYKAVIQCPKTKSNSLCSKTTDSVQPSEKIPLNCYRQSEQNKTYLQKENVMQKIDTLLDEHQNLEGCILVQNDCVWQCRLRISAEALFLSLTATPSDLPLAEKLGVMLGLDLHKLYDIAADAQLSSGQFAQAVHLYQLSKCPQLKRVAHFMGYGFLSELIAYIQVLFSTKGVEIVSADKCHFANIALHCFAHQVKNKLLDRHVINIAFKKFLKENAYYDEEVAAKLFCEQGLNELLHYFAKIRGQQGLVVDTLLSTNGIKATIDKTVFDILCSSGYEVILHHSNDEYYMKCMTSCSLLQFLAAKPSLLNLHLQHLITLLPNMAVPMLHRVAILYNPSHHVAKLFFRNLAVSKINKRYWSVSSLTALANEIHDITHKDEEISTIEDVIKFFIFVLLMLFHKIGCPKFCYELIEINKNNGLSKRQLSESFSSMKASELCALDASPISCGQAHVAYLHNGTLYTWGKAGNGRLGIEDTGTDYHPPQPVITFLRLQINVLAVSCGALHTLALTDFGVFGWGSSRFGQLGMGELQQTNQPRIIESLFTENVTKIQCGQYHSVALNAEGRVLTWGWGVHGQLGHGDAEDLAFPKAIESLKKKKIISICAGQGHTVLLNGNGDVYTFGCGMFGQLGTGSVLKQSQPQLVNVPESIKIIATGHFHVLTVSRANKVYTWGCNPQALRLQAQNSRRARHHGINQNSSSNHTVSSVMINNSLHRTAHANGTVQQSHLLPNLVNISSIDDAIVQLSCGSHHALLVTASGKIFSWGRNSEGQIGNGTRKEQKIPSLIVSLKDKNIVHAACGADFSVAIDSSGKIYGWGQNDGGQVGQKPVLEPNTKYNSGTSSGRVITIRTNRRMITITQPCRQSILRPVEINIPHYEMKKPGLLDSGSFENEYPIMKLLNNKFSNCGELESTLDLSQLDDPFQGPYVLHAALEIFHIYCDSSALLSHCVNFGNFQAAAKLCALENMFDQAVKYQLEALAFVSKEIDLQMALHVIGFYTNLLGQENIDMNQKFLTHVIKFWMENNLPTLPLESFFQYYNRIFAYPLSLLMFSDCIPGLDPENHCKFVKSLTTRFCLTIMHGVLTEVEQGFHLVSLLKEIDVLSDTVNVLNQIQASDALTWDESIPQDRLWLDIMHNLQTGIMSQSAILLTSSDVDLLAKSLLSEKLYVQSFNNTLSSINKLNSNGNDAVIFSCGHHYTLPAFQANILPSFKESLHTLFYSIPQTIKLLLSEYQEDLITAACPKCVGAEINSDL
ncbi:x-linked retinitis pigmentosa GTPase regulator homolog [Trichonephila inaurata madagascariensis]|uniref:X-linked retinitis pigmentosa GTPase regulator homolog n=1 Tax=Trichonephila inaurata madagascariensis TaxID=2747483 RepID=A0A8X7BVK4_9ARAC|nr:x-linked retinitis pigmentosa GTPase regulator homolog [Trichonephila inaurata madagascariensis]